MDYLERNIKDSYNQKMVVINAPKSAGSVAFFFALVVVWAIAVCLWKLSQ